MESASSREAEVHWAKIEAVAWEWVRIQIVSISNLPKEGLFNHDKPDAYICVTANGEQPDIDFDSNVNEFKFPVHSNETNPKWYRTGVVAYTKDTASSIKFTVKDKNDVFSDKLILEQEVPVPPESDSWEEATMTQGDVKLTVRLQRSSTPICSRADYDAMQLQAKTLKIDGDGGDHAVLMSRTNPKHSKCVLYYPGRGDVFANPLVFEAFWKRGYDFYSLDPRRCGRSRRYMEDPAVGHTLANFDEYEPELDLTMKIIADTKKYDTTLAYCHSTGLLVCMNYHLLQFKKDVKSPFDGIILDAPFLDWGSGAVGGNFMEFVLENGTGIASKLLGEDFVLMKGNGISTWWFKMWIQYRWDLRADNYMMSTHMTAEFCNAVSRLQEKLLNHEEGPLLPDIPSICMSSKGDDTLTNEETLSLVHKILPKAILREFDHHNHNVVMSNSKQMSEEAIDTFTAWMDKEFPS